MYHARPDFLLLFNPGLQAGWSIRPANIKSQDPEKKKQKRQSSKTWGLIISILSSPKKEKKKEKRYDDRREFSDIA